MKLVDTHCHLDLKQYEGDIEAVLDRASGSGVERIIVPGISSESSEAAVELAGKYKKIYAAVGIHPHEADKVDDGDIERLRRLAVEEEKIVAIGEIGLDYFKGFSDRDNQKELFKKCLRLASGLDLPVIIHSREAGEDVVKFLRERDLYNLRGVVHCFSGDRELLAEVLSMDLYVSFAGNITFDKASDLRELAKEVPVEKLLLETDGPYLTPLPHRGKRNEPAYVENLLEVYAGIYGLSREDIARVTTHNANELFSLGLEAPNTAVYAIRDSLYVNLTNRCTNRCSFCTRNISHYVKGYDLKLDSEPSAQEIIAALDNMARYKEVVFCGLGEPTLRMGTLKKVSNYVKENGGTVRINTNGEADLIEGKNAAKDLKGLVDKVSISLNADDAKKYQHLCRSVFGEKAYPAILNFVKECGENGIEVEVTCLDFVGEETIKSIRRIIEGAGAELRLRKLNVVG